MKKIFKKLKEIAENKNVKKKILITLALLAVYRLLVAIPVPFVNIEALMDATLNAEQSWLGYFVMLLGWSLENFSLIAAGLAPFINASIIMQLMTAVIPKLEELTEQWEAWQIKIQQYTRYLTLPLAFLQGIWMVFFINYLLSNWWAPVIDTSLPIVILSWFAMAVWSILIMRIGELITEKWITNGISILIFASIVSGISQQIFANVSSTENVLGIIVFMLVLVLWLILLSIFILKSIKEIPVIYSKRGKVEQSSILPLPMNPVGMIPIIFAIAFVSFPYLISNFMQQIHPGNAKVEAIATWIGSNLNIYTQQPATLAIILYFILIVAFTFFYTLIVFSPDKMADNIQKRWGFIRGIRPGKETSKYINSILMHLCLWGGSWLALIGIYSYVIHYIPFIQDVVQSLWSLPIVVTGSGVIIIVWVVQDLLNKVDAELLMKKYDKM